MEVIGVDRILEVVRFRKRIDMSLELRPTQEPIETRDLELRVGDRRRSASLEQVFSLVFQMPDIGSVGKRAWRRLRIVDMATSFHRSARCPHIGPKEGSRTDGTGGLLPFPRTGCVLVRDASVVRSIQQVKEEASRLDARASRSSSNSSNEHFFWRFRQPVLSNADRTLDPWPRR